VSHDDEASAVESIRRVVCSLADANPADDIETEKLQLGQLMSRITSSLSLQCITDEIVTQVWSLLMHLVSNSIWETNGHRDTSVF